MMSTEPWLSEPAEPVSELMSVQGEDNAMSVTENADVVLKALAAAPREADGRARVTGAQLDEMTGLWPADINDAVEVLKNRDSVKITPPVFDSKPYSFMSVEITAEARREVEA